MEIIEIMTHARNNDANLLTNLTPTNTSKVIKVKNIVP